MRVALILTVFLLALSASAQQSSFTPSRPAAQPDYSSRNLLNLFRDPPEETEEEKISHDLGLIEFSAFGTRFHFAYMPLLTGLSGAEPWINDNRWPDPFALSGTELPLTTRTYQRGRPMSDELLRIETGKKSSIAISVKP